MVLLIDDETRTYWDHITGEAVHGPLTGARLETWPLHYRTASAALQQWPDLCLAPRPRRGVVARVMGALSGKIRGTRGFLPPGFRSTMAAVDPALPEMTPGLAVIDGERARFYPMSVVQAGVVEDWGGRALVVSADASEGFAQALWEGGGERPVQLMMRWYGFNLTWPHGTVGG